MSVSLWCLVLNLLLAAFIWWKCRCVSAEARKRPKSAPLPTLDVAEVAVNPEPPAQLDDPLVPGKVYRPFGHLDLTLTPAGRLELSDREGRRLSVSGRYALLQVLSWLPGQVHPTDRGNLIGSFDLPPLARQLVRQIHKGDVTALYTLWDYYEECDLW